MKLTRDQVFHIVGIALVDPRTVHSIYAGKLSKPVVRERVVDAAKKLKLPLPPAVKAVQK